MNNHRRWRALLALTLPFALVIAACGSDSDSSSSDGGTKSEGNGQAIRLAPQGPGFAESETLTYVYGKYLEAQGFEVTIQKPAGFRDGVYPLLADGKADLVIDYDGSAATFLDDTGTPSADAAETYTRLEKALEGKDLEAGAYAEAQDANALLVTKEFAEENDLENISDLAAIGDQVTFGASSDCTDRPDCLVGYEGTYGIEFKGTEVLDYGPPLAAALDSGAIQAAQYQTTAPGIGDKYVALVDDKKLLSADNVTPIFRSAVSSPELIEALDALSKELTTEDLIGWNEATDVDKEDPQDVAQAWLEDKGLL